MRTKEQIQTIKWGQHIADRHASKWLNSVPLVIVSYDGVTRKVNLYQLLKLWWQCKEDGFELREKYPFAADGFSISLVENEDDPRCLPDIFDRHDSSPHVAVWCYGDQIPLVKNKNGVWEVAP